MLAANPVVKLRIVQQKVRKFSALLHKVQLGHAGGCDFELFLGDTE